MKTSAKLKLEPVRLTAMLKQILGKSKDPIKDQALMLITPDGVKVAFQLASDVCVFANYNKTYFKSLSVPDDKTLFEDWENLNNETTEEQRLAFIAKHPNAVQLVVATVSFVKDRLAYGFKGDELTFSVDQSKLYALGATADETVDETRAAVTKELLEAKATYTTTPTEIGLGMTASDELVKSGQTLFNMQALINPSYFADLPAYENVTMEIDGKTITMHLGDQLGNRKRVIGGKDYPIKKYAINNVPQDAPTGTPLTAKFNMKLLTQLAAIFDGDVWLNINEGAIVLSQKYPDYSLTYVLAAYDSST